MYLIDASQDEYFGFIYEDHFHKINYVIRNLFKEYETVENFPKTFVIWTEKIPGVKYKDNSSKYLTGKYYNKVFKSKLCKFISEEETREIMPEFFI